MTAENPGAESHLRVECCIVARLFELARQRAEEAPIDNQGCGCVSASDQNLCGASG
jgi:hypothetical protein